MAKGKIKCYTNANKKYNNIGIKTRNIIKFQNALGKYTGSWYNIVPYGLDYVLIAQGIHQSGYNKGFSIATIKDEP